jgi:MoaA/NifB/PqqE/SkfB family radical SAM enzyme
MTEEWSPSNKWNPFNSYKLLAHVYRWRLIKRGTKIPPPVLVTVDPINECNLSCDWCNSARILKQRHNRINTDILLEIADGLVRWRGCSQWPQGVEAVCIAGGGEPLLHKDIGKFIEACVANGIEVGMVTNGTLLDKHLEPLSLCSWVGVSVDAGTSLTFQKLKGRDVFDKICKNINMLVSYSKKYSCNLAQQGPGYGVGYKFLLNNGNIHDIVPAVKMAKQLGCRNFHLRPAGIAWDKIGSGRKKIFQPHVRGKVAQYLAFAREFEDRDFGVYGITHKFDSDLNKANRFKTCHAIFMTAVIMPPADKKKQRFSLALCCDRRGDNMLEFGQDFTSFKQVENVWGSEEHWQIFDDINLDKCPRCTYQPHNQIFEHVIENDSMTYKFI